MYCIALARCRETSKVNSIGYKRLSEMKLLSKVFSLASSKALNLKRSTVHRAAQAQRRQDSFTDLSINKVNEQWECVQVHAANGTRNYGTEWKREKKKQSTFTDYIKHDVRALIFDAITLEQLSFSIFYVPDIPTFFSFLFINVSVEYCSLALFVSC